MKLRLAWFTLLLVPVFLLSACSSNALSVGAPDLSSLQVAATQVEVQDTGSTLVDLVDLQDTFEQIYDSVNPSVVNIQVLVRNSSGFGAQNVGTSLGSGFVWDREGHIVTNAHVVEGAGEISVTFFDRSTLDATLVGTDAYSDLAVIRVDASDVELQPVELSDSGQVKVGQIAIAIGNPFGLQGTMTQGIISGLSRSLSVALENPLDQQGGNYSIPDIIQTDAPINPGNSGGALVDIEGRLIGVPSAIATTTQSNSGVGFAIPANIVKKFVPELIETGQVRHSWMGISGTTLTPDLSEAAGLSSGQQGVLVMAVTPSSPAQEAGLQAGGQQVTVAGSPATVGGDVILAIDGQTVERFEALISYLYNNTEPGQEVTLTVLRDGQEQNLQIELGVLPG
jgi:2-alkenal reductase